MDDFALLPAPERAVVFRETQPAYRHEYEHDEITDFRLLASAVEQPALGCLRRLR
jgi:hypothetical protein